jgi:Holliday junction DNA helicase RuvB
MTYYPCSFEDYIGQKAAVRALKIKVQSARNRGVPMGATLIHSPYAGVGKSALAELVATHLGSRLTRQTEPLKPAQVPFLFAELKPGDVLLLDEVHKQFQNGKANAEWLLAYLERNVIPTTVGERPAPPVTVIAATTDVGALSEPFLTRFETKLELDPYTDDEAASIAKILAQKILVDENGLPIPTREACAAAARAASNNPREIIHLWETLRDLIMSGESDTGIVNGDYDMTEVLDLVGVTPDGLDSRDCRYLSLLLQNRGDAVGERLLMDSLGEDRRGIRVLERRLTDKQLVRKTKGGRVLTPDGIERSRKLAA